MCSETYVEREVVARERGPEHDRGDERRRERASSAFCAESASRRRRFQAANEPATSAYATRPKLRRSAARPSCGHLRSCFFAGAYFDGHFVESESLFATKTPLRSLPVTTTSRPTGRDPERCRGRRRRARAGVLLDVAEHEAHAGGAVRVAASSGRPCRRAARRAVVPREVARLDLRRPGAGDRGVEDEDGERRRNGQRDDEPGGTAPHGRKDTRARSVSARQLAGVTRRPGTR